MENLRVSELAKELNLSSKELIEKFAEIDILVKSHSNTVTSDQIRKVKEHMGLAPKKTTAKKAFIVKKAKTPSQEPEVVKTEAKEQAPIERIERVKKAEPETKLEIVSKNITEDVEKPVEKKVVEKPALRIERTKIEYPKNQSRIEIVRKAPAKSVDNRSKEARSEEKSDKKPFNKQGGDKKLVERRIIPQEIYEGKGQSKKKSDNKRKIFKA